MRMSDWSSDVCSSDLLPFLIGFGAPGGLQDREAGGNQIRAIDDFLAALVGGLLRTPGDPHHVAYAGLLRQFGLSAETGHAIPARIFLPRSEEHTSELQSLMRISYAVFCLKTKKK